MLGVDIAQMFCFILCSGLMDKHTLTSDSLPLKTSRYAAAVFKDGKKKTVYVSCVCLSVCLTV